MNFGHFSEKGPFVYEKPGDPSLIYLGSLIHPSNMVVTPLFVEVVALYLLMNTEQCDVSQ